MKKYIVIFSSLFLQLQSNAQGLDTNLMLLKAKVCLLEYANIHSQAEIFHFFEAPISFRLLKSKGFSEHIFFVEVPVSLDSTTDYIFLYNYNFIFAFNSKNQKMYRLKGFFYNEFDSFIEDASFANNIDYLVAEPRDLSSLKKFTQSFYIEGLNMKCLYKSLKKIKKRPECIVPAQKTVH